MKNNPYKVSCPKCGAAIDSDCQTPSGCSSRTHTARWKAVGISKPKLDQIQEAYEYMQETSRLKLENEIIARINTRKEKGS